MGLTPGRAFLRLAGLLALLVFAAPGASCLELTYLQTTGGAKTEIFETIRSEGGGFVATVRTAGEESRLELDAERDTRSWTFRVPADGTEFTARREGGSIRIEGRFKDKPVRQVLETGGLPWYEFQELSLDPFASSPDLRREFLTIDRSSLKPTRFTAVKKETAQRTVLGAPVRAVRAELTVAGIPPFLFLSHFWLRETDGRYLRLEIPAIAGLGADTVVELTAESGTLGR